MLKKFTPFFALIFVIVAVWLSFYSSKPQTIETEETSKTTFSTSRAFKHIEIIAQQPHYPGSAAHSQVRNYIVNQLQELNLEVQTQEGYSLNKEGVITQPQNILTRIEGSGDGNALVVMSHYDSAGHSSFGASDAGSGVATILEGIRAFLAGNPEHKNDIILLFTDAEELGLNGAKLFMEDHPWAKDVELALNFEARGSAGNSFMLMETNSGNAGLIKGFIKARPDFPVTNSLAYSVYKMLPNDTDLTVLRKKGRVNGFNFAFIDDHFDYHTATDIPKNLDKRSLAHQGSYLMPLLDYFKDAELSTLNSEENRLYFNLPLGEILSYPFAWIFPMLILAFLLFFLLLSYGFQKKHFTTKQIFHGFAAFSISLIGSGILIFLLWKFCLMIYPEYSEMEQGFTYNGYFYIAAAIFLSLTIAFFTYHHYRNVQNMAGLFAAPLFFWLLLCTLVAFYLKGAAYFIIPVFFGLFQWLVMLLQKKPNLLLTAFLSFPAIFILMPFITTFPVALGLNSLFVAALLSILLFVLLLPVFAYFKRKKVLAVLCFLIFNILFITAHFKSGFDENRPKPNSLVYILDADENKASWRSYDSLVDSWTENFFGEDPIIYPLEDENSGFKSKYSSHFTFKAKAPEINLKEPSVTIEKNSNSTNDKVHYVIKITSNRNVNRIELFADRNIDFEEFRVNGLEADEHYLGEYAFHIFKKRWQERLLTYHVANRDTLRLNFTLKKDQNPELVVYEASYDLFNNEELNVPPREETMIPRPFVLNDAVIIRKTIQLD